MENGRTNGCLLLIDSHSLIHRAFHALPPLTTPDGRPAGALYGLASMLLKIVKEGTACDGVPSFVAAAFDRPEPTRRKEEYDAYKGTRAKAPDELISQLIEARTLVKKFAMAIFEEPGWEADDIIATLARRAARKDMTVNVLSGDFDVLQTTVYGDVKVIISQRGINNIMIYDRKAAEERFGVPPERIADYKGLVGDASDNIPGAPGIGPKSAAALILRYGPIEKIYEHIDEMGISEVKAQDILVRHRTQVLLSKKLAVLHDDLPLSQGIEDCAWKQTEKDVYELESYFEELGFKSLIPRMKRYYNY